jgi:hypothetical protein
MKKSKTIPPAPALPEITDPVWIVRTCDKDMKGYGGFPWPTSGYVEAPEKWNPAWGPEPRDFIGGFKTDVDCGGGLHGVASINDDWAFLDWSIEAKALVVKTDRSALIQANGKVKIRFGIVERVTSLAAAICGVICTKLKINALVEEIQKAADLSAASGDASQLAASGYDSKLAASGYASKLAASGYASKLAASGYASKLAASGDDSQLAASGDDSKLAASGDASQLAASGYASKLAASGYASKLAASGDASKLAASGYASQLAASGYASKLAASGYASQLAASGDDSIAMAAGSNSLAMTGKNGAIALAWHDGTRRRIAVGYVGENGIEADTWYRVDDAGCLVKANA